MGGRVNVRLTGVYSVALSGHQQHAAQRGVEGCRVWHAGVCLETQGFPNAVNEHAFPSVILGPGEKYRHEVDYAFSAE